MSFIEIRNTFTTLKSVTIITLVFVAVVGFLPTLFWYQANQVIVGGDFTVALDPILTFPRWFYTWISVLSGGQDHTVGPATLFYQGILLLGQLATGSIVAAQKIFFAFWLVVPNIGMVLLGRFFCRRYNWPPVFIFFSSVIYTFNLYRTALFNDGAHMAVYAMAPFLVLLILQSLLESRSYFRNAFLVAMIGVMGSLAGINPPMFAVLFTLLVAMVIGFFIVKRPRGKALRQKIFFVILCLIVFLGINAYWVLPFGYGYLPSSVANTDLGEQNLVDWLGGVSGTTSIFNNTRLLGAWDWFAGYNDDPYIPFSSIITSNPIFIFFSLILPLAAFSALLITRNKILIFFELVIVVGILLGCGLHEPMSEIFKWLVQNVPLFWMFRSPWYKFTFLIALGYSLAGGFTFAYIYKKIKLRLLFSRLVSRVVSISFLAVVVLIFAILNFPLINGDKFPREGDYDFLPPYRVEIPDYVLDATRYLNNSENTSRVLNFPPLHSFIYKWNFAGVQDVTTFITKRDGLYNADLVGTVAQSKNASALFQVFKQLLMNEPSEGNRASQILRMVDVDEILQKSDMRYDFYGEPYEPEIVEKKLDQLPGIKLAHIFDEWRIYEADQSATRIYPSRQVSVLDGNTTSLGFILSNRDFSPAEIFVTPEDFKKIPSFSGGAQVSDTSFDCLNSSCELKGWQLNQADISLQSANNSILLKFENKHANPDLYLEFGAISEEVHLVAKIDGQSVLDGKLDLSGVGVKTIKLPIENIGIGQHVFSLEISRGKVPSQSPFTFRGLHVINETPARQSRQFGSEEELKWEKISPTKYRVHCENMASPYVLVFSENKNSNWKAYRVPTSTDSFWGTWGRQPLSEETHLTANTYANAWYITEGGDYDIIIEYWPQKVAIVGWYITGFTLLLGIVLLIAGRKYTKSNE